VGATVMFFLGKKFPGEKEVRQNVVMTQQPVLLLPKFGVKH
jgi:hypothetical protein